MDKLIEFELENGDALAFNVTLTAYNTYLNKTMPNNKIQPAHNFLMATSTDETKPVLRELLKQPGAAMMIVAEVLEEYQPDINLTVKKSKKGQKPLSKTD